MKENPRISNLHCKFAEKPWNDTFELVRRCMERSRDESKPCEPLVRCLVRLQKELQAPSMNKMKSRLELIAKQQGMGFHFTEATCYLTADLFYLEALLLPSGEVQEVKVAPHGEHPTPSDYLLRLLRSDKFTDFSMSLGELFDQYNIPGGHETKSKLLTALKCLWKDLQQISDFANRPKSCETQIDLINNSRVGLLKTEKQDCPPSIYFYVSPNDCPMNLDFSFEESSEINPAVQVARITIGTSELTHKLQMTSLISQPPQVDAQGFPAFLALDEAITEMLPACFLLRPKTPIPMLCYFVGRFEQITDVTIPDCDLQWAPLPKLLVKSASANSQLEPSDEQEVFTVLLPGSEMNTYILPESAWDVPTQRAALIDGIPFTHPAHISAVLELLRHQCAVNTLLKSCLMSQSACPATVCDRHYEVRPESATSISVTFHQPHTDRLAVVLVNMPNPRQITCKLFGAGLSDNTLDEYLSTVMMSCLSIPLTMSALYTRLQDIATAPSSSSSPATTVAENNRLLPVMDTDGQLPTVSQSAAVPDHNCVPGSVFGAVSVDTSELHPEITASTPVDPYPVVPDKLS